MGVRGLTTYINHNRDAILEQFYLHNSKIVVDGHCLCAQLYRSLNCFSAFGGDYDKFAIHVKNFFKSLRKCNITPFVLFDGSHEDKKLRTIYNRLRSKINGASRLDPVTQGSLQIFPLLLRDVFIEVLNEMQVPYTVCEFEADDEIAAMARYLDCPVLSYDSDFFIYNVLYIPFNTLDLKPHSFDENGNITYAMECKIFRVENFTSHFGGLSKDMMPLLATLLGNDYVEKHVFHKFFSQLKLQKSRKKQNEQQRCIHGLLKWLQNETLDSAIAKILGRLKKNQKQKVLDVIKKSISAYNSTHCDSLKYFNIEAKDTEQEAIQLQDIDIEGECLENSGEDDTLENSDGNSSENSDQEEISEGSDCETKESHSSENEDFSLGIPHWLSVYIRQNRIPKSYLNLYTHHLYFCSPQAEDYMAEDAGICILTIIRYAFDILTDFEHESCVYVSREKDCRYQRLLLDCEYSIPRPLYKPFNELSEEELKLCFNKFLEIKMPNLDLTEIKYLPENFKIFMIAVLWWVKYCSVPLSHVHSLIICYTMLEVIDEKTGTFRGHFNFNNKYGKKVEELKKLSNKSDEMITELFLNKNKVQYEDCLIAAGVLLKHFEIDDSIRKKPKSYDAKKMHSFAQFQCSLMHLNCLNTLCSEPFVSTRYSKAFNGTFVYNIALKLENQINPVDFLEKYLFGARTVLTFYKSLCKVYDKCAEIMCISTAKEFAKTRRGRRKRKDDDDISFIVKGFESEVVI